MNKCSYVERSVICLTIHTIQQKENTLKELELRCEALEQSYNNLKQAKILSLSDNAVNETKERISKLVREIDRCIESLKK